MMTLEQLENFSPREIMAQGVIENGPEKHQLYMTNYNVGKKLLWVAIKGGADDWAIYIHWETMGVAYVIKSGDKVYSNESIRKLVPCDDEVLKRYRK